MHDLGSTRIGPPARPAIYQLSAPVAYRFDPISQR
jgi:hypothetical protein